MPAGWLSPTMRGDGDGRAWSVTKNPSAEAAGLKGPDIHSEIEGFEIAQSFSSSSSSIPSASSTTPTIAPRTPALSTTISTSSLHTIPVNVSISTSPTTIATPPSPSLLKTGSVAGIAITSVAILGFILLALYLLVWKRRRANKTSPYELNRKSSSAVLEKYAHSAELAQRPREMEMEERYEREGSEVAVELPGGVR
ncbi:hypothetical protein EJ02DRAFT_266163 [Clathrospora elynae]|uniref:Uncharacterized protein n=1 Tax=Clathrospora elynae TaxID=706981 RepID=A0A6A5SGB0_9PLEO|nr:hypothetical protein EJ02DRAFT_266163 [Clathrospora elynae]